MTSRWARYLGYSLLATVLVALALMWAESAAATSPAAPSFAHRTYPAPTQAARNWAYRKLGPTQFGCLDRIFHYESGWRVRAGTPNGAYGIPQAYPGYKMRSEGSDWLTNPMTQVRWGIKYVHAKYGSPCNAWTFKQQHGWY